MRYSITYDNEIFYSEEDTGYMYKTTVNGEYKKQLTNIRAYYLEVFGDWVYFSNYNNDGYLSKVRIDGLDQEVLKSSHIVDTYIENDELFFTYESTSDVGTIKLESIDSNETWIEKFEKKYNVSESKKWTITFNQAINDLSLHQDNIFIDDNRDGLSPEENIQIEKLENNIVEISLTNKWEKGKRYYLFISNDLESNSGNLMENNLRMAFEIDN